MRCTRILAVLAFVGTLLRPTSLLAQQPESFTPLFNGQDLDGWDTTGVNTEAVDIGRGCLRLRSVSGWLLTPGPHDQFALRFEARTLGPDTVGGVLLHAVAGTGSSRFAYEVRVSDAAGQPPSFLKHANNEVERLHAGGTSPASGKWQTYLIEVRGPSVDAFVNGTPTLRVRGFDYQAGRIGFQVERGALELRHIAVRALSSLPNDTGAAARPAPVFKSPVPLHEVKPKYSNAALRRGIQGEVRLECVVLVNGQVGDVTVVRSLDPDLDANAVAAAKKWRFKPGTRGGQPVRVLVTISMSFTLKQ
jgi:TonB family protein